MQYNKMKSVSIKMKLNYLDESNRKRKYQGVEISPDLIRMFFEKDKFIQDSSEHGTVALAHPYTGNANDHLRMMTISPTEIYGTGKIVEYNQREVVFEFKLVNEKYLGMLSKMKLTLDRMLIQMDYDSRKVVKIAFATLMPVSKNE